MVSSLEQQKRLKLDELKSQAQKLDKQVVKLKKSDFYENTVGSSNCSN